jgi:hypothetical protein
MSSQAQELLIQLQALANPENVAGMARYGINPHQTLGISIYDLRRIAKTIEPNHALAEALWASGIHEARILASYIERPEWVSEAQPEPPGNRDRAAHPADRRPHGALDRRRRLT